MPPIRSFPSMLRLAGVIIWLGVCATTLVQTVTPWGARHAAWTAASLAFAVAYWHSVSRERPAPLGLLVQGVSITVMVGLMCNGFEGLLLVLMAAQLGYWRSVRGPLAWIGATAVALFVAISVHWSLRPALLLAPPYLGFSMLMFAATRLLRQEGETAARLAAANHELQQAQAARDHAARLDERLRIMQGLHDSLGHRLTAMNINLEIAAHSSPSGEASGPIRTAQILGRAALAEIRTLVQENGEERDIDLERELRQLTEEMPRPKLHVQYSSSLSGLNQDVARILLQSVQEVTTNAIRHGAASNLWIEIARSDSSVQLLARDDGQGAEDIHVGFGLAGIQRRVEARGGKVSLGSSAGRGFEVRLEVPWDAVPQS